MGRGCCPAEQPDRRAGSGRVGKDRDEWNNWSGRWESNPSPNTAKLLNPLIATARLGSIRVHNRGYLFDCGPMRITYNMPVNLECGSRIGMTKLSLHNFRCGS